MKHLILLLAFSFSALAQTGPISVKNQGFGNKATITNLQAPNRSATLVAPQTYLLEDSDNFLHNGSFEHSTYNTGWTNVDGTLTESLVAWGFVAGVKGAKLVTVADNVEFYQDSTLYASALIGSAGTISGWISNTAPNVYFCQRIAGAWIDSTDGTQITNCKLVNQTGVFTEYSMPVTFGATSNGAGFISLNPLTSATVTTTGTTYFDKIKVAAGQSFIATSNDTDWASCGHTTSDFTGFGTVTAIETQCKRQGSDLLMRGPFTSGVSTTVEPRLALKFNGVAVTSAASPKISSIQNVGNYGRGLASANSHGGLVLVGPSTAYVVYGHSLSWGSGSANSTIASTGDLVVSNGEKVSMNTVRIPINGWDVSSSATLQSADSFSTDTNVLTHKTTAIVASDPVGTYNTYSFTVSTNGTKTICATPPTTLPSTTNGVLIYTRVYASAGTCNLPARYEIKIGSGMTNVQRDLYKSAGKTMAGDIDWIIGSINAAQYGFSHKGYDDTTGILTMDAGETWSSAVTTNSFIFNDGSSQSSGYLVINAQKRKDFMVGDISGLEKCATTLDCTDSLVAKVSSTDVVSDERLDFINGNCTDATAGQATCTFNTGYFTAAPICVVSGVNATGASTHVGCGVQSTSSSQVVVYCKQGTAGLDRDFQISCDKTGADYIGKTAKAVASDQNDRTPGVVGVKNCSAKISSTGVISDQKGGCFTSCTNATSPICTFTTSYWTSGVTPNCGHVSRNSAIANYTGFSAPTTTTMVGHIYNTSGTAVAGDRYYFCTGE